MVAIGNGLTKLNIPNAKTSGNASKTGGSSTTNSFKATVAKNLSTASKATGNTSKGYVLSSTNFGIGAQRSVFGSGLAWNAKAYNGESIGNTRSYLNSYRLKLGHFWEHSSYNDAVNCNGNCNGTNKFASAMMAMAMISSLGAQTANAIKSSKSDGAGGADKSSNTTNTTSTSSNSNSTKSLGEMKNAKSSSTLDAALQKARADLSAMSTKIPNAESELSTLKGETDKLRSKYEGAQKDLTKNEEGIKAQSGKVNEAQNTYTACKNSYDAVKNLPDTETDSNGKVITDNRPTKAKAKAALEKAEADLKAAKEELAKLQEATKGLKQAVGDAKDAYDKNIESIKTKQDEVAQLKADQKELNSEIPKQQKRLEKLQKQEDDELSKIDNKITDLASKASNLLKGIDVNDENGLSSKDIKNKEQAEKLNAEAEKQKARKIELENKAAIRKTQGTWIGGSQFKTAKNAKGEDVYAIDGNLVNKDEYNRKKTELENQKS